MRRHTVKLIFNPNADMGNAWKLASDLRPIVDEFGGADWSGTVYPTHVIELAMQADVPLRIHIDGEIFAGFGSDVRKLKAEVIPDALEIQA